MVSNRKYFNYYMLLSLSFILGCTFTLLLLHANTLKLNTSPGRPNYRVLVIVISAFENHDKRIAIRETWAQTKENIRVLFILSKNQHNLSLKNMLENEKSIYNDILEVNVPETYNSLSIKLLEALKHIDNLDFQYLLKCDDDSFVDLTGIVQELSKLPKKKLYWGYFNGIANVKKSGKWKESEWILCDKYLPYALGGGYVISKDLVSYIIKNQNYLSLFISEDVTVGAWLAPLNITRKHDRRFDTEFKSRGCNNKYLITHKQSPEVMRLYWSRIQNTGKMCENEYKEFNSYEYNWTVLPSKCCLRNSILSP